MTGYRSGVPENWFVDPVNLGVPGVRRPAPVEEETALAWQADALCAQTDPEAFFPEKGGSTREAKKVCLSCEVRVECLEYALEQRIEHGVWGGCSERERRRIIRQRRAENVDKGDLLSLLLHARDEDDGRGMNDQQVRDEVAGISVAALP